MYPVETNPGAYAQSAWPTGLPAPAPSPWGGLHEHRLVDRPVLNTLLEHLPGDLPYSTHLELGAARARLVHRTLGEAIDRLAPPHPDEAHPAATVPPPPAHRATPSLRLLPPPPRDEQPVAYTLPRRRWPLGGLIDLLV